MERASTTQEFFEQKYASDADPWNFEQSPYELGRYQSILNALHHRRYKRALEPGCSVGVLTVGLAVLCDDVYASDISPTAVARAQHRCRNLPNVHITCEALSSIQIRDDLDLIVFSEIGYYFEADELARTVNAVAAQLSEGGIFLATHWLGASADHVLSGDCVHGVIAGCELLQHEHAERSEGFRLDRWRRR